ncbi:MAG: hypothetical protein K0R98_1753 [Rickettsiaceae bacterium]|jgi:PleD family two-component response regulator|nr:hypothetical protein [Rickettsiaceae bacterium]
MKPTQTLIIDNDITSAQNTRAALVSLGITDTKIVSDIEEAKSFIENNHVMLVTIELDMDEYAALSFIKWLRRNNENNNYPVPVIGFSDRPTKEIASEAQDSGVTEFIAKPFDKRSLKDILLTTLSKPRNFIISRNYTGPDRRRKFQPINGDERRLTPPNQADS